MRQHPAAVVALSLALTGVIGLLDFLLPREIPLQLAYFLPVALIASVSSRSFTLIAAFICMLVSEATDAYAWNLRIGTIRDIFTLIAFVAVGSYVHDFFRKQDAEEAHVAALENENTARVEAEEQLGLLIGTSALAILSLNSDGKVLQANEAADRMFSGAAEDYQDVRGRCIRDLLPSLASVLARSAEGRHIRTMMQAQGKRMNGTIFLAEVWFSNYDTRSGKRVSVMLVDVSEEFRSREESIAEQLLSNSRLAIGAMAHEMRNLSSAVQLVSQSLLMDAPELAGNPHLASMRELMSTLESMASIQLSSAKRSATRISLNQFASELNVVAHAVLGECGITLLWRIDENLPAVWADSEGLMQVFLNLLRNATEALTSMDQPTVCLASEVHAGQVELIVSDNGPGIHASDTVFQPFSAKSNGAGLGLFLARAVLRSYRGDLVVLPQQTPGAAFVISLERVN